MLAATHERYDMINVQTRSPWAVGAAAPDEQAVFPLLGRQCASCHVCLSTSATLCSVDRVPARISGMPCLGGLSRLLRMRCVPFTRPKLKRLWIHTVASNVSGTRARLALWTSGVSFSFMLTDSELDTWAHELRRLSAWFSWICGLLSKPRSPRDYTSCKYSQDDTLRLRARTT